MLNGVPTPVLQSWLGHRSLAETERYVELAGGHHDWVKRVDLSQVREASRLRRYRSVYRLATSTVIVRKLGLVV